MDNASLKSERSFNGPDLPELLREIHQFLSVLKVFCLRHMMGDIFLRKFVHLGTDLLISIMVELRCTKFRIIHKTMVDPFKIPLDATLFQIMGQMIFFLFLSFPISLAMRSSLFK